MATSDRDDFVILSIAVREPPDEIAAFISAQSIEISPLLDLDGRVSDLYGVRGLPTSLFVDRDGVIVSRQVGPLEPDVLDDMLRRLAAPPAPTAVP